MKNVSIKSLLIALAFLASNASFAIEDVRDKTSGKKTSPSSIANKAANCVPSSQSLTMSFNDVSAFLQQGGRLFQNPASGGVAGYEIPKGSGLKAIFAGSLWMGGVDANGQLKLAAVRFRQLGNDFWSGPLTVNAGTGNYDPAQPSGDNTVRDFGPADIQPDQCVAYDKFFTIRKGEVINFKNWWDFTNGITTEPVPSPSNEVLNRIMNWPAHGDVGLGQDFYLAPFYDNESPIAGADGAYDPMAQGDYPWYDDILGNDDVKCGIDRRVTLFGDETHWWVFNDKGNIHTETGGDPIGMEIRAQAFSFATNDEVNRMTFYNYELINRGTQTLFDTYFAKWLDPDLGNYSDDYVGCDVSRGLGFCYNGLEVDATSGGATGYGANPPAIGVDFFEGPYLDADGFDNPGPVLDSNTGFYIAPPILNAIDSNGIVYRGIGTGYSDGLIDNERFGMRRFTYFTNGAAAAVSDPSSAPQYYNYMEGKWANGNEIFYGGDGFATGTTTTETDYVFPGDSDPLNWGTGGIDPGGASWVENSAVNGPGDRRFVQAAGPFTLKPGAVNNITVGIVYGRGNAGVASSITAMKAADTKAQALFDACFQILSPPDAPRLKIQELENEIILTLDNPLGSNNYEEEYIQEDKVNIVIDGVDRFYRFEGYQIFQMLNSSAGVSDIADETKARLVAQCDIKNFEKDAAGNDLTGLPIDRLVNFEYDEALGFATPVEKVNGSNTGIKHSFVVKEDQFAIGDKALVNHKTYYYIAIAYAHNLFKEYDPNDPAKLDGQKLPYIASRLSFDKTGIKAVAAVPHNPRPELGGTSQLADYGMTPKITRLDGHGNGGRVLEFTSSTESRILDQGFMAEPEYQQNKGPINIKVVDPLNLVDGYFEIKFTDFVPSPSNSNAADTASWVINRYDTKGGNLLETISSEKAISIDNEQLIPQWGVSVQISQTPYFKEKDETGNNTAETTTILESEILFKDSSKRWLTYVSDADEFSPRNWIRSGIVDESEFPTPNVPTYNSLACYKDEVGKDPDRRWTRIAEGLMAPHRLVGYQCDFMPLAYYRPTPVYPGGPESYNGGGRINAGLAFSPSIDIVITNDKEKWTKCIVLELGRDASLNVNDAKPGAMRKSASKDINGNIIAGSTGQSWFPGYAIDLETGARLHMAFGENSFLGSDGGTDMIWNPSPRRFDQVGNPKIGGMQPIYVFSHKQNTINNLLSGGFDMSAYSGATNDINDVVALMESVESGSGTAKTQFYSSLSWIGYPLMAADRAAFKIETPVRIRIRVNKEYKSFVASNKNDGKPMYSWDMGELSTKTGRDEELTDVLKMINVVPNPYYAFSEYETGRLDTRVKITNLPDVCNVNIYSTNGKLVKSFKKDSPVTSLDWDLNNNIGIPIASGIYLIHVDVPGIGETVLKFFGGIRQVDLQGI
ncbi:T9SS type A sorting domain-containing protein [Crocinitomicaceae bacterium]|nr:T9SS type A sorting domain-containing protein [Crocinitomicaceae bacterium]